MTGGGDLVMIGAALALRPRPMWGTQCARIGAAGVAMAVPPDDTPEGWCARHLGGLMAAHEAGDDGGFERARDALANAASHALIGALSARLAEGRL